MTWLDEFVAAARDGIDADALTVAREDAGFRVETPTDAASALDEAALREFARDDPFVRDWYAWERDIAGHGTARRAFLRWLERADDRPADERYDALARGVTRTWGELAITVALVDGDRRYEVRHVDDRGTDVADSYTDPLDARELVKHDDDGRYRPLSTAPTLPHGWAFVDLTPDDAVRTVDFVYPATIANWHREREGELDVDHWDAVAARQTGIFDVVDELDRDALEWAAEACCVDSQCVKRREWDASEGDELDVPRGDGEFPCREACSLFVAAARTFTLLEREASREYTFELTPTEKEQLEAILDAVADDATDDVREADLDDPANRYRARYLRAKRAGDGGLSDASTDAEN